jgi:hypothetical protein
LAFYQPEIPDTQINLIAGAMKKRLNLSTIPGVSNVGDLQQSNPWRLSGKHIYENFVGTQ